MARADIIVVTHNCARWLPRLTAALVAQTETDWRLIVFDNNSSAEERPRRADLPPKASIIYSAVNLGFAEANNRAAREGKAPYLVFLNPDAFPRPDWLATLLQLIERYPNVAAIGSTQLRADAETIYDGTGDVVHASGLAYRSNYGRVRAPAPALGETFSACAAAMLVRRDAFEAVSGFDSDYFCYFEDVDLGFRLRLAGWRILQSPRAIVAHVGGGVSGARSPFGDFHGARNRTWTFIKCMPPLLFWLLLPAHLIASATAVSWALLSGRGLAAWRGYVAGLAGWAGAWRKRRALQAKRKASTATIAAALAWSPLVLLSRRPVIRKAPRQGVRS